MSRKRLIFLGLGIAVIACVWFGRGFWNKPVQPSRPRFISAYSVTLTPANVPRLQVEIGDLTLSALVDLGLSGSASATNGILDSIPDKVFYGTTTMYGWNGKRRSVKGYIIPNIRIGKAKFHDPILQESSDEFEEDTVLIQHPEDERQEKMRLGWHLFHQTGLFLDIGNRTLLLCDSAQTLIENGYDLKEFSTAPLRLDRRRIEFDAMTSSGPILCHFDTGATLNIRHTDNPDHKSMEQLILDPTNVETFASFQIGGRDFGPMTFHLLPTQFETKTEAVLGMEFFLTHQVFIDFLEKQVYFAPTAKNPSN